MKNIHNNNNKQMRKKKKGICTLWHPQVQKKLNSLFIIAKVMSAPLPICNEDHKDCLTLMCFVLQNTDVFCESLNNAFLFLQIN